MKRRLTLLACVLLVAVMAIALFSCVPEEQPHEHTFTSTVTKAATCTENGTMTYTCECGEGSYTESIPATGHAWGAGAETTAPTCTEDGVMTYTCKFDSTHTYTEAIDALGHDWDDGVITTPATCIAKGEKTFTCTVAGCGATETEEVAIDAEAHSWNEGEITTPATCVAEGVKTYTCTVAGCGKTKTEAVAINADAHTWNNGEITKAATCVAKGEKTYTCTVAGCGKTKTEEVEIDPTAHNIVTLERVEPTCYTDGKSEGKKCDLCQTITVAQTTLSKTGNHAWEDEGEVTKSATCVAEGEKTFECTTDGCTATYKVTIGKTGHSFSTEWSYNDTVDGHFHLCTVAGCTEHSEPEDHTPGPEATYEDDQICTTCGKTLVTSENHEHKYTEKNQAANYLKDEAANCQSYDTYWKSCKCGASAKDDENATGEFFVTSNAGDHDFAEEWTSIDGTHYHVCNTDGCGVRSEEGNCSGGTATCVAAAVCGTCGNSYGTTNDNHAMSQTWSSDGTNHFHACTREGCNHKEDTAACSGGTATCQAKAACTVCGNEYGATAGHDFAEEWTVENGYHYYACQTAGCTEKSEYGKCAGGTATCQAPANCETCGNPHGDVDAVNGHTGGTATCQSQATCTLCGNPYGETGDHDFTKKDESDFYCAVSQPDSVDCNVALSYYYACQNCDAKSEETYESETKFGSKHSVDTNTWVQGDDVHYHACTNCTTYRADETACSGGTATCQALATCPDCNQEYGSLASHGYDEKGVCTVCKDRVVSISFDDTANRVEFSTEKQVWQQNTIVFTNDKAESSSNVADYVAPIRIYKDSTITIDCEGMYKIVFNCVSGYVIAIDGAKVDGSKVTVVFDEPVDTYTITVAAAARFNSITVYADEKCEHTGTPTCETPATCEKCGRTYYGDHVKETLEGYDATCYQEGLTDGVWCSVCETIFVAQTAITATGDHNFDASGNCTTEGCDATNVTPRWELVYDASVLKAGDKIVIVAKDSNYAMGTTQNSNNRNAVSVTKNTDENTVTFGDTVVIITLVEGKATGTFGFEVTDSTGAVGYLYVPSSSSNYLRTETALSNNGSFEITISSNGSATIKANSRIIMKNSSSELFSAYASGQKEVCIYKYSVPHECNTDVPATCTEAKKCSVCGKASTADADKALGHEMGEPVVTDATCTEKGSSVASCTRVGCEYKETTEIPSTGHNFENGVCTNDGCDETESDAPALKDVTYSHTVKSGNFTSSGTATLGSVNWTWSGTAKTTGAKLQSVDGTKGQQFGSKNDPYSTITITSTTQFTNVTKITVNTSGASGVNAKITVKVGGVQIGTTQSLSTSATNYTFESDTPLTGVVEITYTISARAVYFKSIEVAYQEEQ